MGPKLDIETNKCFKMNFSWSQCCRKFQLFCSALVWCYVVGYLICQSSVTLPCDDRDVLQGNVQHKFNQICFIEQIIQFLLKLTFVFIFLCYNWISVAAIIKQIWWSSVALCNNINLLLPPSPLTPDTKDSALCCVVFCYHLVIYCRHALLT